MRLPAHGLEYLKLSTETRLIPVTIRYFDEIEQALAGSPDVLGVNSENENLITPLVSRLIDGNVTSRTLLQSALGRFGS